MATSEATDKGAGTESCLPNEGRFDLALIEARRGFDEQFAQLGKLRTNVGGFLGYGGVAFSALIIAPGQAKGPTAPILLGCAVGTFVLMALAAAWVFSPATLIPGVNVPDVVTWADSGMPTATMTRDLALHYESAYQANKKQLVRRTHVSMAALGLFSITIILLGIRLTGV